MKIINKSIKFYLLIDIRYYLSIINKRLFFIYQLVIETLYPLFEIEVLRTLHN